MKKAYLEVEKVYLRDLQNAEFIGLLQRSITLLPRKQPSGGGEGPSVQSLDTQAEDAEISDSMYIDDELVGRLQSVLDQLSDLTLESRSDLRTKELEKLDRDRDALLGYAFKIIGQAPLLPLETQRQAGLVLDNELGGYTGTGSLPRNKETTVIRGMLRDSKKTEVAEAISTLGLTPIFAELERLNDLFEETDIARNNDAAPRRTQAKTKELRDEATLLFEEITDRAFAANLLHGNDETRTYILNLNEAIHAAKTAVNLRGKKGKGDSTTDKEETPGETDEPSSKPGDTDDSGTTTPPAEEETPPTDGGDDSDRPVVQ